MSSTPTHGVLAALPAVVRSVPASLPIPTREAISVDAPFFDANATEAAGADLLATLQPAPDLVPLGSVGPVVAALVASPAPTAAPPRARVARPAVVVRAASRPARLWAQLHRGLTVAGQATWYFGTNGYAGIAHVAMPGARYLPRGRSAPRARICAGSRCTIVAVVDACACRAGTPQARLVDISVTALGRLGLDPRRGVYQVRVTLLES